MSENEQNNSELENIYLSREDISYVYGGWMPVAVNQIRKDYAGNRIGRKTAIAHQQVWAKSKELMLLIADHGLTVDIVIGWLELELEYCEERAREKEQQTAAAAA